MSTGEIIEGNKLIAEFMNVKVKEFKWRDHINLVRDNWELDDDFLSYDYDSNWNLLMGAIDKIESLDIRNNGYDFPKVKFSGDSVEIFIYATYRGETIYWKDWYGISGTYHKHNNQASSKIEAVWLAVVEFINWYNETNINRNVQESS